MESKGAIYTPELGKAVAAKAVPHDNPNINVLPENGRWTVFASGRFRAIRILDTKTEAIRIARKVAVRKESTCIVIYDKKGNVEREIKL